MPVHGKQNFEWLGLLFFVGRDYQSRCFRERRGRHINFQYALNNGASGGRTLQTNRHHFDFIPRAYLCLLVFFAFFILIPRFAVASDFFVESTLSKNKVALRETFEVTVQVTWPENHQEFQITKITPPESPLVKLTQASQSSSSRFIGNTKVPVTVYRYQYQPLSKGEGSLSAFVLELITETGSVVLKKGEELPVAVVGIISRHASLLASAVVVFIFGTAGFFLSRRIRKMIVKNQAAKVEFKREEAMQGLESRIQEELELLKKHLVGGEPSRYLREVRSVLSRYVDEKFKGNLPPSALAESPKNWQEIFQEFDRVFEQVAYAGNEDGKERMERLMRRIERELKQ